MSPHFDLYNDINARTGGEIYIGVVGPVRTGKSTFIKRFMDLFVIPNISDLHSKERAIDELPQSATGKTIMTTEPKFIPKEAAKINLGEETDISVRMIDCVGYMVEGATGHIENEAERMVKTPWYDYEIPFTKAAEIGTKKVINDHSTIGIVITTDGSFGELSRDLYIEAEEKTINELKAIGKPFIVLVNTTKPFSNESINLANQISEKHGVSSLAINCEQLRKEDINKIMENILSVFPITKLNFKLPKWVEMLSINHWLKEDLISTVKNIFQKISLIKDAKLDNFNNESEYIEKFKIDKINMNDGSVEINVEFNNIYYYKILSDMVGVDIEDEYELISTLKELADKKGEFEKIGLATNEVINKGYGVVSPMESEIKIEEPELIKHGNKYGVRIKAKAPSIHMIKADIITDVAPIVGSKEQAEDLLSYINENTKDDPSGIWDTNIFGKSIRQLVEESINTKINKLTDESQLKLQETMQKIINDSNGGLICIII